MFASEGMNLRVYQLQGKCAASTHLVPSRCQLSLHFII